MKSVLLSLVVMVGAAGFSGCSDPEADRAEHAASEAAKAAEARAREAAAAKREAERLADLWTYSDTPAGKGRQLSTYLYSTEGVDTDGQGAKPVQLVFRDHPSWGRSSYLVLQGGDFNCYSGCTVKVTVDDAGREADGGAASEDRRGDRHVHQRRDGAVAHDRRSEADQCRVSREGWRHAHGHVRNRRSGSIEDAWVELSFTPL